MQKLDILHIHNPELRVKGQVPKFSVQQTPPGASIMTRDRLNLALLAQLNLVLDSLDITKLVINTGLALSFPV